MIEYVRAELIRRLKMRRESMCYCQKLDQKFAAREERRQVARLLRGMAARHSGVVPEAR